MDESRKRGCLRGAAAAGSLAGDSPHRGIQRPYLLRKNGEDGVEFVTLTLWESLEAVRAFAGEDYEKAVVLPEARRFLVRFDERSVHYEVRLEPQTN